jgi:hypothetical protein
MLELIFHGFVFGLFAIFGLLILMLCRVLARQQKENFLRPNPNSPDYPAQPWTHEVLELRQTLISMLRGDTDALNRLMQAERARHGERGEVWVLEKCIRDLERDRRP